MMMIMIKKDDNDAFGAIRNRVFRSDLVSLC